MMCCDVLCCAALYIDADFEILNDRERPLLCSRRSRRGFPLVEHSMPGVLNEILLMLIHIPLSLVHANDPRRHWGNLLQPPRYRPTHHGLGVFGGDLPALQMVGVAVFIVAVVIVAVAVSVSSHKSCIVKNS